MNSFRIYRYLAVEFLMSFLVAFLFFFFIFFVNQLLVLAEEVLSKRVPFFDVARLIFYSFPAIIAFSFPFASLVGGLMAVGRLSGDNEMLAMQASGLPLQKLAVPFLMLGLVFSSISFMMNDYFLPIGTMRFTTLYRQILSSNPELELESNSIKRYQDSVLITGGINEGIIDQITILDRDEKGNKRVIVARNASLLEIDDQYDVISLVLHDVFIQTPADRKQQEFEYSTSDRMIYNILLKDISDSMRTISPQEMSSRDVHTAILEKERVMFERQQEHYLSLAERLQNAVNTYNRRPESSDVASTYSSYLRNTEKEIRDRSLQLHRIEFNKKLALPLGCFIFLVFAFPVGMLTKRSGRSVGFGIGLLLTIVYWGMLFAGQNIALRNYYSPVLAIWAGNIFVFVTGILVFIKRSRV